MTDPEKAASCTIEVELDADQIEAVMAALQPDNTGFVDTTRDGNIVRFTISSGSVRSLRHTIDDLMACLKVAESASRK